MGEDKITWKVEGSDTIHSIPDGAILSISGQNGTVHVWIDEHNNVIVKEVSSSEVN